MPNERERLIALARFQHEGRTIQINDEFETDKGNAADLIAMRFAKKAGPRRIGSYRRRDLTADEPAAERRDLTAETEGSA